MSVAEIAMDAATGGATTAVDLFETSMSIETKSSRMDFVTDADTQTQRAIIERIRDECPDAAIVAEEGDERRSIPSDGDAWIIDPIDGTTNFVHEVPLWTTTVAVIRDSDPVTGVSIAPALDKVYKVANNGVFRNEIPTSVSDKTDLETFCVAPILRYGPERDSEFGELLGVLIEEFGDLRRLGCAQLTLAMVASGSLDAAISAQPEPNPWDTVAGVQMVEQSGGKVTDIYGERWEPESDGLVATNGAAHDRVLNRLDFA